MFILKLKDMRSAKIEHLTTVGWSDSREVIEKLLADEKVEPYQDAFGAGHSFGKTFRKGGPLEWYNPPEELFGQGIIDLGTYEDYIAKAQLDWNSYRMNLEMITP